LAGAAAHRRRRPLRRRWQGEPTIFTLNPAQVAGSEKELVYTAGSIAYCMEEYRYVAIL